MSGSARALLAVGTALGGGALGLERGEAGEEGEDGSEGRELRADRVVEGVPGGVLLGDVGGGGRPPGGLVVLGAVGRAGVDEDGGAGVGDGLEQRQRLLGVGGRGEPIGGEAHAGGAGGDGLPWRARPRRRPCRAAGVAAHQPSSSGSCVAASCQAAMAARASRAGRASRPTGADSATRPCRRSGSRPARPGRDRADRRRSWARRGGRSRQRSCCQLALRRRATPL